MSEETNINFQKEYKKLKAKFENYKKRKEDETEKAKRKSEEEILKENFKIKEKIEKMKNKDKIEKEDLEIINKEFEKLFNKKDIEKIDENSEYSPETHKTVAKKESEDYESGEIIEYINYGYVKNGKVIKEAKVITAE